MLYHSWFLLLCNGRCVCGCVQHFALMDNSGQHLSELESSLAHVTAFERYKEAAELKKKVDAVKAADVVEELLEVTLHAWVLCSEL